MCGKEKNMTIVVISLSEEKGNPMTSRPGVPYTTLFETDETKDRITDLFTFF